MNLESIREWTRRQPFRPFRLRLLDGSAHEIYFPDMLLAATRELVVGIPDANAPPNVPQHSEFVAYEQIAGIEPLASDRR